MYKNVLHMYAMYLSIICIHEKSKAIPKNKIRFKLPIHHKLCFCIFILVMLVLVVSVIISSTDILESGKIKNSQKKGQLPISIFLEI